MCACEPASLLAGKCSLRSERFQSSNCEKVRSGAKKKKGGRGRVRGEEFPSFPSPSPVIPFFFCSRPNFLDELARKRLLRMLGKCDSRRYSFRGFSENVAVTETSYQILEVRNIGGVVRKRLKRFHSFSLLFITGKVNEKIDFMVDARKAGRGRLTGKLTGVKYHTDVEVIDLKDGTYACHYLVPQPGAYVLSLMWNGQHIPNSPYKVTIKEPQVMKASSCLVEGKE